MKILFYNWVDYLDDEKRGGGVSVYVKNVIHSLRERSDVDCWFLSSGVSYDLFDKKPRWDKVRHGPRENRGRRFEIVNSNVLAPAHHSFGAEEQITDIATQDAFFDFIRAHGPYDAIHFNNLEGLPASVLKLKEYWPETRVIFSLHNYYPVCPQVNLWHQERENCLDFDQGRKCVDCLPHQYDQRIVKLANAVAFRLKKSGIRPGTRLFDRGFGPAIRIASKTVRVYNKYIRRSGTQSELPRPTTTTKGPLERIEANQKKYARRRKEIVSLINGHCDKVLCVSNRVGEVAQKFGIAPELLETGYIGTRHAEKFQQTQPRDSIVRPDGTLTIAYLGYMRRDKGFFFLLDALENMPDDLAEKIKVAIASKISDRASMKRIEKLSQRYHSVFFADGYAHDELDDLLADVDLGVVPVLWEDNLPQVAIEMHARHIPLLTSDLGGAQELGNCNDLVFTAGDKEDFAAKLIAVLGGKISVKEYWTSAMAPYSMQDHLAYLMSVYRAPVRRIQKIPSVDQP